MVISIFVLVAIVLLIKHYGIANTGTPLNESGTLKQIGSAENNISVDINTASSCLIDHIEKYSRFLIYNYDRAVDKYYLVQQNFEIGTGCHEGYFPANVTVTAKQLDLATGKVSPDNAWSFKAEGISGEVQWNFFDLYKVSMPGCCGAMTTNKYFSLKNGQLVLSTSINPLKIDIANTKKVGYIGVENGADPASSNKNTIATIFYGTNDGVKQKLSVLSSKSGEEEWIVEKLSFPELVNEKQALTIFKKENFNGVPIRVELVCRCDREPVKITLTMSEESINAASAQFKGADDVSIEEQK